MPTLQPTEITRTASPLPMQIDTSGLTQDLTAPPPSTSPTSPHSAADAQRAMSSTDAWQPRMDRRQSWSSQEYKHELQKGMFVPPEGKGGFSER